MREQIAVRGFIGRHRRALTAVVIGAVALLIFVLVWFQPQKLFIDDTVAEGLPPAAASGEVTTLTSGTFRGLNHSAEGTAHLIRSEDGTAFVRFADDFVVENGPDLVVWLSAAPASSDERAFTEDFIPLAGLKGNIGSQNYEIPSDVDLSRYRSVLVWCRRFNVGFAAAPLES